MLGYLTHSFGFSFYVNLLESAKYSKDNEIYYEIYQYSVSCFHATSSIDYLIMSSDDTESIESIRTPTAFSLDPVVDKNIIRQGC